MKSITSKKNKYLTMSEVAVNEITEAILYNDFQPGTRLIPGELEKELNLGRVAIREAIKELACTGLVTFIPNKGAVVASPPSMEEITEIFELRFLLEGKAAQLAATRMSADQIKEIEGSHQAISGVTLNSKDFFLFNREFHHAIYAVSGWTFLCRIISQLFDQVFVFRNLYPFSSELIRDSLNDHEKIIASIKQRDPQMAKDLMVSHLHRGVENFNALLTGDKKAQ